MAETVLVEIADGIGKITLNRPEKLNALTLDMIETLDGWVDKMARDENVRVLLLTGTGKAFTVGPDFTDLARLAGGSPMQGMFGRFVRGEPNLPVLVRKFHTIEKPVIAAVNGVAAGAGLSLALACDIRLASDDARFRMGFLQLGLVPDCAATFILPRLVGPHVAAELVFTDDIIDAQEAQRIGLVNRTVPAATLPTVSLEMAKKIAGQPPVATREAKRALRKGIIESDLPSHMEWEVYINHTLFDTADFKEAVAAFREKRKPHFTGR